MPVSTGVKQTNWWNVCEELMYIREGKFMGTVFSIILDILAILAIIVFGSFIVVVIADLILCLFDNHEGIIFNKHKSKDVKENNKIESESTTVKKDDIVVYSNQTNPNGGSVETKTKTEKVDGEVVSGIDFDKAVEEQQALNKKRQVPAPEPVQPKKPVRVEEPKKDEDIFWDIDEDQDFKDLLDEVVKEAKGADKKQKEVVVQKENEESKKAAEQAQKELDELKALKEQHQKELDEFKQMKEDFAREKEEQLALYKDNLDKLKAEELDKLKQEIIAEQEKLAREQEKLEDKQEELEEKKNAQVSTEKEEIIKETIIKDEEEINKLKFKNLVRMNNRLSRIIRDTEKLQEQKQKDIVKKELERKKMLAQEQEEKLREQERRIEIQRQNHERLQKQTEALRRRNEINRKLNEVSKRAGKYKLDNAKVIVSKDKNEDSHHVVEEVITTVEETIPGTDTIVKTVEKTPIKASATPIFEKAYYEQKLVELDEELREAEKELRVNKSEYIPLTRIHKAYARDSEKLRKKEILVAKQKVALYGVNSTKIDPAKKAKLDENLANLTELKDSVEHCEEVIRKNKDRYPVLEKNNKLLNRQIERINDDIKTCEKAISYYNKKNK